MNIESRSFEIEDFKYLTKEICIKEENKNILKSRNVCCFSVWNLKSSSMLSKNLKNKK